MWTHHDIATTVYESNTRLGGRCWTIVLKVSARCYGWSMTRWRGARELVALDVDDF
jgi:hypothetical protein